jgi:TonB-dependent starch-binding outer membrane protein SusC
LNNSEYGNSDAFRYAPIYNPTAPVRSDDPAYELYDGYFQQILFDYYNPAAMVDQTDNNGQYTVFNMRLRGDYILPISLSVNASYSMQTAGMRQNEYYSKYSFYRGINRNGLAFKSSDDSYNQLFEAGLRWTNNVDFGNIDIEAGYSYQEFTTKVFSPRAEILFPTPLLTIDWRQPMILIMAGQGRTAIRIPTTIMDGMERFAYSWKERLFLNMVGRYDGSSMFGENEKYGFYPGISAGVDFARYCTWHHLM